MAETRHRAAGLMVLMSVLIVAVPVFAADAVGMRVVRDPATGQLRAPTAEEANAMDQAAAKARADATAAPQSNPDTRAPVEIRSSNGVRYRVNDSFLSYSVVSRKPDGTLAMQCVTGKGAADKMVRDPRAVTSGLVHSHKEQAYEEK